MYSEHAILEILFFYNPSVLLPAQTVTQIPFYNLYNCFSFGLSRTSLFQFILIKAFFSGKHITKNKEHLGQCFGDVNKLL